jgi:uncharacterized protein involved in type VI secretion and phage assembly
VIGDARPYADLLSVPVDGWHGVYVAVVTDNQDPDKQGRVKVELPWSPDRDRERYETWARVATLMAGNERGTWFVPDPDDEVLVAFEGGDARWPIVIGSMWNGVDSPAEQMEAGNHKRTILTGAGVRITLDDSPGAISLLLETPGGQRVHLEDSPATVTVEDTTGNSVTLETSGVTVVAASSMTLRATTLTVDAPTITVKGATTSFAGLCTFDTIQTSTIMAGSYLPGAGNIW